MKHTIVLIAIGFLSLMTPGAVSAARPTQSNPAPELELHTIQTHVNDFKDGSAGFYVEFGVENLGKSKAYLLSGVEKVTGDAFVGSNEYGVTYKIKDSKGKDASGSVRAFLTTTAASAGEYLVVQPGEYETFTLNVIFTPKKAGTYWVVPSVLNFRFNSNFSGAGGFSFYKDGFETEQLFVDPKVKKSKVKINQFDITGPTGVNQGTTIEWETSKRVNATLTFTCLDNKNIKFYSKEFSETYSCGKKIQYKNQPGNIISFTPSQNKTTSNVEFRLTIKDKGKTISESETLQYLPVTK